VKFVLHLFGDAWRSGGNELTDMRTKFTGGRVDDLEFFFDTDSEAVRHSLSLRQARSVGDYGLSIILCPNPKMY
jgi:hypothetical protein